jgi:threonyl-tRNA synthetase
MNGFELIKKAGIKDAVALILNKEFKDLCSEIPSNISDEEIEFVLKSSQDGLDIIRHSTAHLMAAAIKRLFPNTIFAIGPSIENGFYYDMDFGSEKFSENDFVKVEEEMKKIVKEDLKFVRKEVEKEEALELFKDNKFKIEIINELPVNQPITLYYLGDYVDLCRGPHVPSTRYLPHFKLTKVSGVY